MKRLILILLCLLPVMVEAQAVVQQNKTPSSGSTAGNQYFTWWGGGFNGYLILPNAANFTANRQTALTGQVQIVWADTTLKAIDPFGHIVTIGGGGSSNAIYFNSTYFNGAGTAISPIGINTNSVFPSQTGNSGRFLTTDGTNPAWSTYVPENVANKATSFGTLNNTLYPTIQAVAAYVATMQPDGVLSGFSLSVSTGNLLNTAGTYRISGITYSSGSGSHALDAQDPTLSRYDLLVGDNTGTLSIVSGALSSSPVYPALPANSILIGGALITPTSVTTIQPTITNYVTNNTDQNISGGKIFTVPQTFEAPTYFHNTVNLANNTGEGQAIFNSHYILSDYSGGGVAGLFNYTSVTDPSTNYLFGFDASANQLIYGDAAGRRRILTTADLPAGGSGTTTNPVTFNNGGSGGASGSTFNGSSALTVSYNTIGAVPTTRTITINGVTQDLSANQTFTVGTLTSASYVTNETPSGTMNGTNPTFTLANTPTAGSVSLFLNGVREVQGTDYTISGATITQVLIPISGDTLQATYLK